MEFFIPMNSISPFLLLLLGFCVSTMSGFFGIGGGWLITPALNILGMPMPYAIGTGLVYIIITSGLATIQHRKLKNVSFVIGSIAGLTAIAGVLVGKKLILYLEKLGNVDEVVRIIYIFFLVSIGIFMLFEKKIKITTNKPCNHLRPVINIKGEKNTKIPISFWALVCIGIFIGFLSSTMGVGGGFLLLPIFIYILKLPVVLAIGTSLFTVLITGFSGGIAYITAGRIDYGSLIYMIITTLIGTSLGVAATQRIQSEKIKTLFACIVLCGGVAVLLKQLEFNMPGKILIFAVAVCSTFSIIFFAYFKQKISIKLLKK